MNGRIVSVLLSECSGWSYLFKFFQSFTMLQEESSIQLVRYS
jgi:hypothetical protein